MNMNHILGTGLISLVYTLLCTLPKSPVCNKWTRSVFAIHTLTCMVPFSLLPHWLRERTETNLPAGLFLQGMYLLFALNL